MRRMLKDVINNKCREKRKIIKSLLFLLNEKIFIAAAAVRRRKRTCSPMQDIERKKMRSVI